MNNKEQQPEHLAAIIAEMRADVADGENAFFIRADWLALCDRIEAAVERERVEMRRETEIEWTRIGYEERKAEERSAPGNAAAMREALDKAECVLLVASRFATDNAFTDADALENLRDVDWDGALAEIDAALAAPTEPPSNAAKMRAALEYARDVLALNGFVEPVVRCDAALATPARNCDRPECATAEGAIAALRANPCADHDFCKEQLDCAECATRWLIAPAKGGAE